MTTSKLPDEMDFLKMISLRDENTPAIPIINIKFLSSMPS